MASTRPSISQPANVDWKGEVMSLNRDQFVQMNVAAAIALRISFIVEAIL
jgi:hypothetical protein